MYRILIVDDEFLVRLGLKTTIDWEANGYEVVGEASNGKEAMEMVHRLNPDIVLVDIKMPVMDGLEFMKKVRETNQEVSFIILSNYGDFKYAKDAMKMGVSQYMLKSEINGEILLKTLESVLTEREVKGVRPDQSEQKKKEYLKDIFSKIHGNGNYRLEELKAPKEGVFKEARYITMKMYCNESFLNDKSKDMLQNMLISLIEDAFVDSAIFETTIQKNFYVMVVYPVERQQDIENYCKEKGEFIKRKIKHYFDVALKGGISLTGKADTLPELFKQAETSRQLCFFGEKNFEIYNSSMDSEMSTDISYSVSIAKISEYMANNDTAGMKEYVEAVVQELIQARAYFQMRHVFIDFLSIAKSYIKQLKDEDMATALKKLDYDNWYCLDSAREVLDYIVAIYTNIVDAKNKSRPGYNASVQKTILYIEKNYKDNITLEDMADYVGISKNYLSMLFKQETGQNLVTYLNQIRIEKGKKLLQTTNYRIYEVAEQVGFGSPYYFSKMFKEITGMQCKEYRDAFLDISNQGE
ncbi:two-component system response regulator YesN [Aequitasia blattaphilus]|uniref:Stage 0 sporulation protein A homolog n=1 Tax=Aequitasia blattaphilus TaxID=2949332 RepID=A0ABT1EB31_9FIRM|nr:response regulator [Aequitasia blattaphilus]MCP1103049.1 response regulator [Aequitasia blattaphilus]MCR8615689.1 response regulator [Aequitasia blattaphilus]